MSIRGCIPLLRTVNSEKACKYEFQQLHNEKDVQIGNVHCRLSRRLCLSIRGRNAGGFFRCSRWFLFSTNEFVLTYHVNVWAAVHNDLPFLCGDSLTEMRQPSAECVCSVPRRNIHILGKKPQLCILSVQTQTFLRTVSKRLHDFRTAHTTQHWDVFLLNSTQKRVPWIT